MVNRDAVLEGKRAVDLSDNDLIAVIRQRGDDLRVANAMATLVRLFEHASKTMPREAVGLSVAVGLAKLYSQNFATGHAAHPFKDFSLTIGDIIKQAPVPAPPPVMQPIVTEVRPPPTRKIAPEVQMTERKLTAPSIPSYGGKQARVIAYIKSCGMTEISRIEIWKHFVHDDDIVGSDLNNAFIKMMKDGQLIKIALGQYQLVQPQKERQ